MSLNISDAETCRMAVELAQLTGETTTGAVAIALREQRNRDATLLAQELHAIGQRCAALIAPGAGSGRARDLLYNERGLPKWLSTRRRS